MTNSEVYRFTGDASSIPIDFQLASSMCHHLKSAKSSDLNTSLSVCAEFSNQRRSDSQEYCNSMCSKVIAPYYLRNGGPKINCHAQKRSLQRMENVWQSFTVTNCTELQRYGTTHNQRDRRNQNSCASCGNKIIVSDICNRSGLFTLYKLINDVYEKYIKQGTNKVRVFQYSVYIFGWYLTPMCLFLKALEELGRVDGGKLKNDAPMSVVVTMVIAMRVSLVLNSFFLLSTSALIGS